MKRKTFLKLGAAVAVVALAVVTLVSNRTTEPMSDLMMQNIEAIGQDSEDDTIDKDKTHGTYPLSVCAVWVVTLNPKTYERSCTTGGGFKCTYGKCPHEKYD